MKRAAWQLRFLMVGAAVFLLGACDGDRMDEGEEADVDVRLSSDTVVVETPDVEIDVDLSDDTRK